MACLGTHFAITADVAARLNHERPPTSDDVTEFLEHLESQYRALSAEGWTCSTDHAWDGIHRSLTDGMLEPGPTPAHGCVLGADERFWVRRAGGSLEYIVNLLDPGAVRRVADAIRGIDRTELRRGYDRIDPESFYRLNMSEHDFEYTWENFQDLRAFFEHAADAKRWVVFRVDQ